APEARIAALACAAAADPQELFPPLVELMVAGRVDVETEEVRGGDRRLVMEQPGNQRRGTDEIAGRDDHRMRGLRLRPPEVCGQPGGAAEIGNRRLQVPMEIVDREDLEL